MRESMPVSWNQRHRLGQTLEDAGRGVFNPHHATLPLAFTGPLDLSALNRAWHALQRRHPVLLSGFDLDALVWHIGLADPVDIERLPTAGSADADLAALRAACAAPFDLERGPMARLLVVRRPDQETHLALVIEHLVSDGWSLNVLMRDLSALYAVERDGSGLELPPVLLSHPDFVRRQNRLTDSPEGRQALDRLAAGLSGVGAIPAMPISGFSGASAVRYEEKDGFSRRLPIDVCRRLDTVARPLRMTALNLMHAALHRALFDLSGSASVATTLSTANRELPELHQTTGWLASKAVLISEPGSRPDPADYLRHFRRRMLDTLDHAHLPWPALIHRMDPDAVGRQSRVPYVTFNARPLGMRRTVGTVGMPGVEARPLPIAVGWHDASIATFWVEDEDGVTATVNFKTDWYARADVEALWDGVDTLLRTWSA
ncbi:condensation domain-containing protein [Kitasatospora sp. NPDC127059]|uniref:condensation domain-containing protein n=1 Tax=unclassified Kitasatospora TaxID=2633591 RepID=UPI003658DCF0